MASGGQATGETARRYAGALFELAQEAGALDAVAADVHALAELLSEHRDLLDVLRSSVIPRAEKAAVLEAVAEKAGMNAVVRQFAGVTAQNGRAGALPVMARAFADLVAEHKGLLTAEVASAARLSEAQRADVKAALKAAFARDVDVREEVRPELIGGLVVRVGSRLFDSSLQTKLAGLASAMKG